MRNRMLLTGIVLLNVFALAGCGSQADSSKPIAEVKAEAEKMSVKDLEKRAQVYAEAIMDQKGEMSKVGDELKSLSPKDIMGEKGKSLKNEMSALSSQVTELTKRYDVYAKKYRELGGDASKIKIS